MMERHLQTFLNRAPDRNLLIFNKQLFYDLIFSPDIGLSPDPFIFVISTIIKKAIMTTQEAANRYHELASQRKFIEIQDILYDEDVVCQEPDKAASMGMPVFTNGREAVKAKGIARRATIETIHTYNVCEPIVAGEFFSVVLKQEVTFKGKPRMALEEIGVFQVKDGKIVKEQFFY
jgi:hypothetical protein